MLVFIGIDDKESQVLCVRRGELIIGSKFLELEEEIRSLLLALVYAPDIPIAIKGYINVAVVNLNNDTVEIQERDRVYIEKPGKEIIAPFNLLKGESGEELVIKVSEKVTYYWTQRAKRDFQELIIRLKAGN